MKWSLASLLTILVLDVHAPAADACGIKLTIKSAPPRKGVAHTSNPSDVLLLGHPPARLKRDLGAAGHRVDVAPTAASAEKKPYAVVIADSGQEAEARSSFPGSTVVTRSGDVESDVRSVETLVARRPVRTDDGRGTLVAVKSNRPVVAAGPTQNKIIAAKDPTPETPGAVADTPRPRPPETRPAPEPKPAVAESKPAPEPRPRPEPRPAAIEAKPAVTETRPAPEPKPVEKTAIKPDTVMAEVYFGLGSSSLANHAALDRVVKRLTANADARAKIEGYADPTGNSDANMTLSQQRAEWVRDYLVSAGIDSSRLEVAAFGDTRLKYGRTDGRNRRVAVVAE